MVDVKESSIEEVEEKLSSMNTDLIKIDYLESALKKSDFTYEVKRYLWDKLVELYEDRRMFEKAAKSMASRATIDITYRGQIEAYVQSAELYSKAGKIEDAEEMFLRAVRNANVDQKARILLSRKNIYMAIADILEKKNKRASAAKFYEKLLTMKVDDLEKKDIKKKLLETYKSLGKFREAELLEGV